MINNTLTGSVPGWTEANPTQVKVNLFEGRQTGAPSRSRLQRDPPLLRHPNIDESVVKSLQRSWGAGGIKRKWLATLVGSIGALLASQANTSPVEPPSTPADFASGFTVHFKLVQGQGVPVCEAYLDLLNRARYREDAFCGRPNNDPAHGFADLKRRDLTVNEILSLFNKVHEFVYSNDQNHPDRAFHPNGAPGRPSFWSTGFATEPEIRSLLQIHGIPAWTFNAPVDVDNDGVADTVLLWQGYPVDDKDAACGTVYAGRAWDFGYVRQRAFILTDDGKQIHQERTRTIFGAPAQATHRPGGGGPFHPLSDSIGVFQFGGAVTSRLRMYPSLLTAAAR